jgi:hypothetical protein
MEQKINIDNLDDLQKQALVCMYYAMLPKTDARYKQRMHDWEVLEKRFGTKKTTYFSCGRDISHIRGGLAYEYQ